MLWVEWLERTIFSEATPSMDWVSTWVTPMGVAHAHASNRTATSRLDRLAVSANWGRADNLFVASCMPALRLTPNAHALP